MLSIAGKEKEPGGIDPYNIGLMEDASSEAEGKKKQNKGGHNDKESSGIHIPREMLKR